MSYDNAKACAVVETSDVSQNMINVDQKVTEIQPENYNTIGEANLQPPGKRFFDVFNLEIEMNFDIN